MSPHPSPDAALQSLAVLFHKLLAARFADPAARPEGSVVLTLAASGQQVAVQLGPDGVRTAAEPKGPKLLSLEGSAEGLSSFFDGSFAQAVRSGAVQFDAQPSFLLALAGGRP